jgi:chemosensory pili system protein ChpA (sensor histidine kinase/response regulator)
MTTSDEKRILIVEDDDANREFLRAFLEGEGFAVATARDGRDALVWLNGRWAPDLVLLDLEMPRMSGWEFIQAADRLEHLEATRVMMLTGRTQRVKILDWLSKPAPPDVLVEKIRQHMRRPGR